MRTKPRIIQEDSSHSKHNGQWFVCRDVQRRYEEVEQEYLHADGVWRGSAYTGDSQTGWFASKADATAALVKSSQPVNT